MLDRRTFLKTTALALTAPTLLKADFQPKTEWQRLPMNGLFDDIHLVTGPDKLYWISYVSRRSLDTEIIHCRYLFSPFLHVTKEGIGYPEDWGINILKRKPAGRFDVVGVYQGKGGKYLTPDAASGFLSYREPYHYHSMPFKKAAIREYTNPNIEPFKSPKVGRLIIGKFMSPVRRFHFCYAVLRLKPNNTFEFVTGSTMKRPYIPWEDMLYFNWAYLPEPPKHNERPIVRFEP